MQGSYPRGHLKYSIYDSPEDDDSSLEVHLSRTYKNRIFMSLKNTSYTLDRICYRVHLSNGDLILTVTAGRRAHSVHISYAWLGYSLNDIRFAALTS